MLCGKQLSPYICARCLCRRLVPVERRNVRLLSKTRRLPHKTQPAVRDENETNRAEEEAETYQQVGRMTQRLAQMTENSAEQDGKGARKAIEEAGFSEELKKQLEARLEETKFRNENTSAFAEINMPVSPVP